MKAKNEKRLEPLLKFTMFSARPEVGGRKLNPLTGGRLAVMEERGNVIATGARPGDDVDSFSVYEAMFICLAGGAELAELSLLDDRDWKLAVRGFAMDVPDDDLNEFWAVFNGELEAAKAAATESAKKPVARREG